MLFPVLNLFTSLLVGPIALVRLSSGCLCCEGRVDSGQLVLEKSGLLFCIVTGAFFFFFSSACINELQKVYLSILLSKFGRLGFN